MTSFNPKLNPGFMFEITSTPELDLSEFEMKVKSKKGSLHIYIAGETSQTTPFDNARFRRVFDKAEVIVTMEPKASHEKKQDGQLPSLGEKEFSLMDKKPNAILEQSEIGEFKLGVLEDKSKAEVIMVKTFIAMILQVNKVFPKDAGAEAEKVKKVFSPEKVILEQAAHKGKEVTHIYSEPSAPVDISKVLSPEFLTPLLEIACGENDIMAKMFEAKMNEQRLCDRGDWKALQKARSELKEAEKKLDQSTLQHVMQFQLTKEGNRTPISFELGFKIQEYLKTGKNHLFVIPAEEHLDLEKVRDMALVCNSSDRIEVHGPFEEPKGYFWKIKSPDGKKGYLLGSIHLTPDYILDLNGKIRRCFQKARILAVEADVTREEVKAASMESENKAMKSKIASLPEVQRKQTAQTARKLLLSLGYKEKTEELEDQKAILLGVRYILKNIDVYGKLGWSSGIDNELIRQAKDRKLEVVDLEDWKLHVGVGFSFIKETALNLISQLEFSKWQNQKLDKVLDSIGDQFAESLKSGIGPMVNEWERGNLEAMDHSKTDSSKKRREMISRNQEMAGNIADLIDEEKCPFAVVGAAHMAGDMSILSFLEQYKFTVTRKFV